MKRILVNATQREELRVAIVVEHADHGRRELHREVEATLRERLLQLSRIDFATAVGIDDVEPLLER